MVNNNIPIPFEISLSAPFDKPKPNGLENRDVIVGSVLSSAPQCLLQKELPNADY